MIEGPYPNVCPVGRALNVIGERWTMMILRDLMLEGPRKFSDLAASFPNAGTNTLSARLQTLEEAGIVMRRFYADHPPRAEYLLTEKGDALRPAMKALRDWGSKYAR
jgi:DNA-binding HxlR family transcriptional regulator